MEPAGHILGRHAIVFSLVSNVPAAPWPPTLDADNTVTRSQDGRTIERFVHGERKDWGYKGAFAGHVPATKQETGAEGQTSAAFYVVTPNVVTGKHPLLVVLHSANRTAYDCVGFNLLGRKMSNCKHPSEVLFPVPEGFYAPYLNSPIPTQGAF